MKNKTKYFIFNKMLDYQRGSCYNISINSSGICIKDVDRGSGNFLSRVLDTREKQTIWHRLIVNSHVISASSIRITLYFSESRTLDYDGVVYDVEDLLLSHDLSLSQKQKMIQSFSSKVIVDPSDILLFDCTGRYMWFEITMIPQGNKSPSIEKIQIYFPKDTWVKYLPEIYQGDTKSSAFLERYLGLFQTLYQDLTHEIDHFAHYFDPEAIDVEVMKWLSGWVAIDDSYIWSEEQLRYLVKHALYLYSIRGTVGYLESMIKLYTGKMPFIVERHQYEMYLYQTKDTNLLHDLYGDNPYICTILVDSEKGLSNKDIKILTRIVENSLPAFLESNIVVLEPYVFLNQYTYLGVNSKLGQYHDFVLDGHSVIPFTTL